ncbi:MAG: hypothetical protein P8010_21450 [Desulfosarcinaceae bacterium]
MGTRGVFITIMTLFGVLGGANVVYRQILEVTQEKGEQHVDAKSDPTAADTEKVRRPRADHGDRDRGGDPSDRP